MSNQWISVKDQYPDKDGYYLVYRERNGGAPWIGVLYFTSNLLEDFYGCQEDNDGLGETLIKHLSRPGFYDTTSAYDEYDGFYSVAENMKYITYWAELPKFVKET